jgi:hypothetical protein
MAKNNQPTSEPKGIEHRNLESKLNLKTITGESKLWTVEEALKPYNFKQLKQVHKDMLLNGAKSIATTLGESADVVEKKVIQE